MTIHSAGFRLWAVVAVILLALVLVPSPLASAKSYGAGQVLTAFDVIFDECWMRPLHDESWYKCDEWNKSTNRQALAPKDIKYVWPRTISYTPFALPSEGNIFLEVILDLDDAHTAWMQYDMQRYDDASGKWVSVWFWRTETRVNNGKVEYQNNTQYDLGLFTTDSSGKPSHPVFGTLTLYPPGKYQLVAWSPPSPQTDAYPPCKGSFTIVFVPSKTAKTVNKYQVTGTLQRIYNEIDTSSGDWTRLVRQPWAGLLVVITGPDGKAYKTSTGGDGAFSVEVTAEGTYTVEVEDCHIFREQKWQVPVPGVRLAASVTDDYMQREWARRVSLYQRLEAYGIVGQPGQMPAGVVEEMDKNPASLQNFKNKMDLSEAHSGESADLTRIWANKKWKYITCTEKPSFTGRGLLDALASMFESSEKTFVHVERNPKPYTSNDVTIMKNPGTMIFHSKVSNQKIQLSNGQIVAQSTLLIHQDEAGTAVYVLEGLATEWNQDYSKLLGMAWTDWKIVHNFNSDRPVMEPFTWQEADQLWRTGNRPASKSAGTGTSTSTGTATGTGKAIESGSAVIRDYDKSGDSFSFAKGKTCSGCNYNITDKDFFIADRGAQSIIHAFESPGVIDMGAAALENVGEAPASGYKDSVAPVKGHTYVFKSRGKYGKIYINDIMQPPAREITEYEFKWAYQADGTRSFTGSSSSGQTTTPPSKPPAEQSNPLAKTIGKFCPVSAAYGSPDAPQLFVFRQFRDNVLSRYPAGTDLINVYYAVSPAVVGYMDTYGLCKPVVRHCLAEPAALILNGTCGIWNNRGLNGD